MASHTNPLPRSSEHGRNLSKRQQEKKAPTESPASPNEASRTQSPGRSQLPYHAAVALSAHHHMQAGPA